MEYKVYIEECHNQEWTIEADSAEEAAAKALDGDGEMGDLSYSHTRDDAFILVLEPVDNEPEIKYEFTPIDLASRVDKT